MLLKKKSLKASIGTYIFTSLIALLLFSVIAFKYVIANVIMNDTHKTLNSVYEVLKYSNKDDLELTGNESAYNIVLVDLNKEKDNEKYKPLFSILKEKPEGYKFQLTEVPSEIVENLTEKDAFGVAGVTREGNFIAVYELYDRVDSQINKIFYTISGLLSIAAIISFGATTFVFEDITRNIRKVKRRYSGENTNISITEFDELADELLSQQETIRKNKEREDALLSDITHELKTPLAIIKGEAELLELGIGENHGESILSETNRMESLIQDILDVSRIREKKYEVISLNLYDTVEEVVHRLDKGNRIRLISSRNIDNIYFSKKQINSVVENYISNALKYSKEDTTIFVIVNEDTLLVKNHGIIENEESVWNKFYKGDKSRKNNNSSGIGLALVKEIAIATNSNCSVSQADGVITFSFKFKNQKSLPNN